MDISHQLIHEFHAFPQQKVPFFLKLRLLLPVLSWYYRSDPRDGQGAARSGKAFFEEKCWVHTDVLDFVQYITYHRDIYIYNYMCIYEQGPPPPPQPDGSPPLWQGRGGFLSSQAMMYVVFIVHIMHMYR